MCQEITLLRPRHQQWMLWAWAQTPTMELWARAQTASGPSYYIVEISWLLLTIYLNKYKLKASSSINFMLSSKTQHTYGLYNKITVMCEIYKL